MALRVSSVVNHDDPDEANVFRSLLSAHLLAAPARMFAPPGAGTGAGSGSRSGAATPGTPTSTSGRADSPPPRKRSRPSSPATEGLAESGGSVIRFDEDPVEAGGSTCPPSPERYRQRTQMFERLLAFVDEGAREPDANLVDMLSTPGGFMV